MSHFIRIDRYKRPKEADNPAIFKHTLWWYVCNEWMNVLGSKRMTNIFLWKKTHLVIFKWKQLLLTVIESCRHKMTFHLKKIGLICFKETVWTGLVICKELNSVYVYFDRFVQWNPLNGTSHFWLHYQMIWWFCLIIISKLCLWKCEQQQ